MIPLRFLRRKTKHFPHQVQRCVVAEISTPCLFTHSFSATNVRRTVGKGQCPGSALDRRGYFQPAKYLRCMNGVSLIALGVLACDQTSNVGLTAAGFRVLAFRSSRSVLFCEYLCPTCFSPGCASRARPPELVYISRDIHKSEK